MSIESTTPIASDARQDFERVSQAMHNGGAREAYQVLKEESVRTQSLSPEEKNAWQREMTAQLTQGQDGNSPILPRLSIAFMEDNQSAFSNRSGTRILAEKVDSRLAVDRALLQLEQNDPTRDDVNDVEAALVNGLNEVSDSTIRNAILRHQDFNTNRLDNFLDNDARDSRRTSSLEQTERNEAQVARLLLEDDGRIFGMVDAQLGAIEEDGRITDRDVETVYGFINGNSTVGERFTPEEHAAIEGLNTVFSDTNNTRHERSDSILNHDRAGQFFDGVSRGAAPVDRYDVTRESLARGTANDPADLGVESTDTTNGEFTAALIDATHVRNGNGYWHVARRLVDLVGGDVSNARVAQLTHALQAANGHAMLHPDQNLYELLEDEQVRSVLGG